MSGRRTLFLDQRCTSVVYCSTCLYRPRANIMRLHSFVFGLVVVAVSAAFLWVISPYAGAVLWGVIFAIMFIGMKERLSARFGGRDGLASLLTLLVIIALVIVPSILLASLVLNEAVHAYQNVSASGFNPNGFEEHTSELQSLMRISYAVFCLKKKK